MQKFLHRIDWINTKIGHFFSWAVFILTLFVTYEVFSRYVFGNPRPWAFDVMNMMYGTLFMMAGAYALSTDTHVRGDVLYGFFPARAQATIDLILYILFFIPGIVAMVWAGYYYAAESFAINEHSTITADGPPIYPFKAIIPLAGAALLLQGFAEICRAILCLKNGVWPRRIDDIEEVNIDSLKEMVTHTEFIDPDETNKANTTPHGETR